LQTIERVVKATLPKSGIPESAGVKDGVYVPPSGRKVITYNNPFGGSLSHPESDKVMDWRTDGDLVVDSTSMLGSQCSRVTDQSTAVPVTRSKEIQDWFGEIQTWNQHLTFPAESVKEAAEENMELFRTELPPPPKKLSLHGAIRASIKNHISDPTTKPYNEHSRNVFGLSTVHEETFFPVRAVEQRLIEAVCPKAIKGLKVPTAAKLSSDSPQGKLESLASIDYLASAHALRLLNFQSLSMLTVGKIVDSAKAIVETALSNGAASLDQLKVLNHDLASAAVGLGQMQKASRDQVEEASRSLSRSIHFRRVAWLESSKLSREIKAELYKSPCDLGTPGPTQQPRAFLLGSAGDNTLKTLEEAQEKRAKAFSYKDQGQGQKRKFQQNFSQNKKQNTNFQVMVPVAPVQNQQQQQQQPQQNSQPQQSRGRGGRRGKNRGRGRGRGSFRGRGGANQ